MFRRLLLASCLALGLAAPIAHAADDDFVAVLQKDAPGSSDSALTGRYEGSFIVGQTRKAFDELTLPSGAAEGETYDDNKKFTATINVQGKVTRTLYVSPEGRSSLEVFGNFVDALKSKGFQPVYDCAKEACGPSFGVLKYNWNDKALQVVSEKADNIRQMASQAMFDAIIDPRYVLMKSGEAGAETYVAVFAGQNQGGTFGDMSAALQNKVGVLVEVVEPKAREDKIVTLSSDEINAGIGENGRVALYGIFFDFDKAAIKPESEPQIAEMVTFLANNPDIRVYVVGHTDSKGKLDYNLKLSGDRATAVVKALAKAGVNPKRLAAKGLGPLAPLASNRTEDGQAKNRRVELVEQYGSPSGPGGNSLFPAAWPEQTRPRIRHWDQHPSRCW